MPATLTILLAVAASVALVVIATVRWKVHPFLSLLAASILAGLMLGIPMADIIAMMGKGFGEMAAGIGIIIALGSMIGIYLEESGAAYVLAASLKRASGNAGGGLAMSLVGALVGIPVFADSGFIMLSAPARKMTSLLEKPNAVLPLATATGLYATHVLVPPTPGPLAAAANLGAASSLGMVIMVGMLMAIPAMLAGYAWSLKAGRKMIPGDGQMQPVSTEDGPVVKPGIRSALVPILLPVLLIMAGNAAKIFIPETTVGRLLQVAGTPMVALGLGLASCVWLYGRSSHVNHAAWMEKAVNQAGPIVLITCAGGSFGAVLKSIPVEQLLGGFSMAGKSGGMVLLLSAYAIAALLKIAQGSSTASMIITSSMLAPLLTGAGIGSPLQLSIMVAAVGAGAMTVSHTNDSYFWVVNRFGGLGVRQTLKGLTVATGFMGLAVLITALLAWFLVAS
ncbi:MAG: GntP family permease [Chitinophagaceae bacterium]|jgi:GntP family gluconate:H+ symporter|nr:GntP family permease [Chitinophagaceae bacterium]